MRDGFRLADTQHPLPPFASEDPQPGQLRTALWETAGTAGMFPRALGVAQRGQ